jgi:hypothetical protein
MYLRTVSAKGAEGVELEYIRLVEAYWENGRSKQRIVANLGRKDLLAPHLESLIELLGGGKKTKSSSATCAECIEVVLDEFGGNVGIVTLQDVIAEVLGQLPDEFGLERQEFERLNEEEFLVDGGLPLHELGDLAGLEWKDEDVTTVGGYVVRRLFGWKILNPRPSFILVSCFSLNVARCTPYRTSSKDR